MSVILSPLDYNLSDLWDQPLNMIDQPVFLLRAEPVYEQANGERRSLLCHKNRCFMFKSPVYIHVRCEGPLWIYELATVGIIGYGKDPREAEEAFAYDLSASWDEYGCEDDQNMTWDAVELKRRLNDMIDSVEDITWRR